MKVLICGASGFIGTGITAALLDRGHEVIAAIRRPVKFVRQFPNVPVVEVDFNVDKDVETWLPRLAGVEAVINCAGILQGGRHQNAEAIHYLAPVALFRACEQAGVRRVLQVSAVSADETAGTDYAATKLKADNVLRTLDLDWIVLRPSLVYGSGSYGGTSLLRGLAALPLVIPLVGRGDQLFRPIHVQDLCGGIAALLENGAVGRVTLEPAGPAVLTLRQILVRLRSWLGFAPARVIEVPLWLIGIAVKAGDLIGAATLNSTAFRQLQHGNAGDPAGFAALSGIRPDGMDAWLQREPSRVQSRWHARLYFLRPVVRYSLALIWLCSGAIGLLSYTESAGFLATLPNGFIAPAVFASCALDLAIGILLALKWRPARLAAIQVAVVVAYTLFLTVIRPALWAVPLGPLLKNLAVLLLIPIWAILENDR